MEELLEKSREERKRRNVSNREILKEFFFLRFITKKFVKNERETSFWGANGKALLSFRS